MRPENQGRIPSFALRMLAGVQTGVLGGFGMLGTLALASTLERHPVWTVPNLLGSFFYGRSALRRSFGPAAVAGLALHLLTAGVIGIVFGMLVGELRNRLRVWLLGILTGLIWYYFSQALLWRELGALSALYSSPRWLLLAHLVYGFFLGLYPSGLRSLSRHFLEDAAPPGPAIAPQPR